MIGTERTLESDAVTAEVELQGPAWPDGSRWSVGWMTGADGRMDRALFPHDVTADGPVLGHSCRFTLQMALAPNTAVLLPVVAEALRAWDNVGIEIGSAAVITPGHPWSTVLAAVSRWYGAVPLVLGDRLSPDRVPGPTDADPVASLARTLTPFPAVSAIELTGRAEMVDLLLEAVPPYTRAMFAGPRIEPITIDYYVNVHRKGLHLSSTVLSPMRIFEEEMDASLIKRAGQLLANPARAATIQAAVSTVCATVETRRPGRDQARP